jgi:hypothetical protein
MPSYMTATALDTAATFHLALVVDGVNASDLYIKDLFDSAFNVGLRRFFCDLER